MVIYNEFVALGPNTTGYPGGYPTGYFEYLKRRGWWKASRLHLCSGSVHDGITIDVNPEVRPTVICDLEIGIPFRESSFDAIYIDPPYSEARAEELYERPLLSVPRLLKEAQRVVRHDGIVVLLDWKVWPPHLYAKSLDWEALCSVYMANRGPKPLRALQVWRKKPRPLEEFDGP